jgi:hypothetical protein
MYLIVLCDIYLHFVNEKPREAVLGLADDGGVVVRLGHVEPEDGPHRQPLPICRGGNISKCATGYLLKIQY